MEHSHSPASIAPTPRCPECGYSRGGLTLLAVCPECGWLPRDDEIILWGYGHAHTATVHNTKGLKVIAPLLVLNCGGIGTLINPHHWHLHWQVPMLIFLLAVNGWALFRRRERFAEYNFPEIARFSSDGCVQHTGPKKAKWIPWSKVKTISVGDNGEGLLIKCQGSFFRFVPPMEFITNRDAIDENLLRERLEQWKARVTK